MGVVHQDRELGPRGGDHLNPPFDALYPGQSLRRRLQGQAQRLGKAQDRQCIIRGKETGNAHPNRQNLIPRPEVKGHMVSAQAHMLRHQVSASL